MHLENQRAKGEYQARIANLHETVVNKDREVERLAQEKLRQENEWEHEK